MWNNDGSDDDTDVTDFYMNVFVKKQQASGIFSFCLTLFHSFLPRPDLKFFFLLRSPGQRNIIQTFYSLSKSTQIHSTIVSRRKECESKAKEHSLIIISVSSSYVASLLCIYTVHVLHYIQFFTLLLLPLDVEWEK